MLLLEIYVCQGPDNLLSLPEYAISDLLSYKEEILLSKESIVSNFIT